MHEESDAGSYCSSIPGCLECALLISWQSRSRWDISLWEITDRPTDGQYPPYSSVAGWAENNESREKTTLRKGIVVALLSLKASGQRRLEHEWGLKAAGPSVSVRGAVSRWEHWHASSCASLCCIAVSHPAEPKSHKHPHISRDMGETPAFSESTLYMIASVQMRKCAHRMGLI